MLTRIATALVFACLVAACATSPTGRKQLMIVSESQAIVASRQAYVQEMGKYKKEGKLVTDPKVLNRVKVITERLVAQAVKVRRTARSGSGRSWWSTTRRTSTRGAWPAAAWRSTPG